MKGIWNPFRQAKVFFHSHRSLQNHLWPGQAGFGELITDECYCACVCVCYNKKNPLVILSQIKEEEFENYSDRPI